MGKVYKYGDHVDTDVIIPARYLNVHDPVALSQYCMIDIDESFSKKVIKGDIIVAGENFGCGSSREHAPIAIKYSGVACVIAKSFARIFLRNSFNIGLPVIESKEIAEALEAGNDVEVFLQKGIVKNITTNQSFKIQPLPDFMMGIIDAGGLIPSIKEVK